MRITSKYPGKCVECGKDVPKGTDVEWDRRQVGITCLDCYFGEPDYGPPEQDFPTEERPGIYTVDHGEEPAVCDECGRQYNGPRCGCCDFEYQQGVADANRYLENRRFLGEEEANRLEVLEEIRRGGEW